MKDNQNRIINKKMFITGSVDTDYPVVRFTSKLVLERSLVSEGLVWVWSIYYWHDVLLNIILRFVLYIYIYIYIVVYIY
jgi:hypothetical protein